MAYTVDEVSDTLGVPRPTLYRYLREYSVPHLRRAGKIYVPEDSFDRIKEIRELHREGLDTESVRRRLQEGSNLDPEELEERLGRISEKLESLQENVELANGASTAQALQTLLARQSLLISAVFNMTEMMEELLAANGRRRKAALGDPEITALEQETFDHRDEYAEALTEETPSTNGASAKTTQVLQETPPPPAPRKRFGVLSKRRRRAIIVGLLALLAGATLTAAAFLNNEDSATSQESTSPISQEEPATDKEEEVPSGSTDDTTPGSDAGYEEDSGEHSRYPVQEQSQDVVPQLPYEEQPMQQEVTPELPYQEQPVLPLQPGGIDAMPPLPQ